MSTLWGRDCYLYLIGEEAEKLDLLTNLSTVISWVKIYLTKIHTNPWDSQLDF